MTGVEQLSLPISGIPCMVLEAVDSTNAYLSRAVFAGDLKPASGPMAVLALAQTAGKGRSGNAWQSTNGNLALSILALPSRPMEEWACLSLVVATSLSRVLKDRAGLDAQVKWPNDLLIDGAKLIGILPEVVRDKAGGNAGLVIGIGMNLAVAPDVPGKSTTSVAQVAASADLSLLPWADAICAAVLSDLTVWEEQGFAAFRAKWMAQAYGVGCRLSVRLPRMSFEATFLALEEDGALQVQADDGTIIRVTSGEVFFGDMP